MMKTILDPNNTVFKQKLQGTVDYLSVSLLLLGYCLVELQSSQPESYSCTKNTCTTFANSNT